jgi:hypothetical protein
VRQARDGYANRLTKQLTSYLQVRLDHRVKLQHQLAQLVVSVISIVLCKLVDQHLHHLGVPRHVMASDHVSAQPDIAVNAARGLILLIDGNHLIQVVLLASARLFRLLQHNHVHDDSSGGYSR